MSLILVIDPHGSGDIAIQRFIETAEKYQCVVIASNLIKNNYPDYTKAIETLLSDVKNRLHINGFVFIAGFSGGSRMAIAYAESHTVDGIFACGALGSKNQVNLIHTPIFSILGMADFNFPEVAEFILYPGNAPSNLFIEISDLKHEWPSSKDIERGIGFLVLDKGNNKKFCFSVKEKMKDLELNITSYLDSLILRKEYIKCEEIFRNFMILPGKKENKNLIPFSTLKTSAQYKNEIHQLQQSLQFEMKVRDAYYNSLLSKNLSWWNNEIEELDKQILNESDKYTLFAYKRIRSFLGILCYSATRNFLQSNDLISASKILELYKLIEPKNPDMFFYSALFEYKSGNSNAAIKLLKEALDLGFTDKELINESFPLSLSKVVSIN